LGDTTAEALRTGSRPRARFLLSTRLTLLISAEPTTRSTQRGSNLPRRPRTRPSCYRHAHPRLLGHLHLFDAADVLSAHLAVAICAKLPQFSPIATNCNCIPSVLLACLLRPLLANAFNRDPPPGHVELGP
jgi:hypothetical protein